MIPTREQRASHSAMLCVVSSTDWPAPTTPLMIDQRNCRAAGSTPAVGSSCVEGGGGHTWLTVIITVESWLLYCVSHALTSSSSCGAPSRAMAADSLRLLPPEYCDTGLSACGVKSSLCRAHSTTLGTCDTMTTEGIHVCWGLNRNLVQANHISIAIHTALFKTVHTNLYTIPAPIACNMSAFLCSPNRDSGPL